MLSLETINNADYSTMVGFTKERNRPSGGIRTISEFAIKAFINKDKKVLEVGSNTGFSMSNLAALTGANCIGIDVNLNSIADAKLYANDLGVSHLVEFLEGNALDISFEDNAFDALWVSNVTSFIENKEKAITEYLRVLKPNGIIGFAPIYYVDEPPIDLLRKVEKFIGAKINVRTLNDWKKEIYNAGEKSNNILIEYNTTNYRYYDQENRVEEWINLILDKPHIHEMEQNIRVALNKRYKECMILFNENLKYCGYSLILFQKRIKKEEAELFITYKI